MFRSLPRSSASRRAATALAVVALLAAGCSGPQDAQDSAASDSSVSDAGGASDGGAAGTASDAGGAPEEPTAQSEVTVPQDPYPVTPAPEGFEPPDPCTGEGGYYVQAEGDGVSPELPERAGDTLDLAVTGIDGDHAELEATIGDGEPRPVEAAALGETVTIDLWTISITSICSDRQQVEFDLID